MTTFEFFELGFQFSKRVSTNSPSVGLRSFIECFGTTPEHCETLWNLLVDRHPPHAKPIYLLWMLLFLRHYETEEILHCHTGVDSRTFRKWTWTYIDLICENIDLV